MPPIFDKDCKLKVIEYGDHSKSIDFSRYSLWKSFESFLRRFFRFAR